MCDPPLLAYSWPVTISLTPDPYPIGEWVAEGLVVVGASVNYAADQPPFNSIFRVRILKPVVSMTAL